MTEKRFEIYCDDNIIDNITKKTYHAYDDYTANELVELLNNFNDENEQLKYNLSAHMVDLNNYKGKCSALEIENEQLKQQKDKWKQQCIHFKEMLDDMDIAYLCDEWIYEEMKGDVE